MNQISTLPDEITNLTNLETLLLEFNQFRYLSDVFLELKVAGQGSQSVFQYARNRWGNWTGVHLRSNPLISPPSEIAEQGLPAIQQYLREQQDAQMRQVLLWIAMSIVLVVSFVLAFRLKTRSSRKPKKKREMVS